MEYQLSYFLKINIFPSRHNSLNLHVGNERIRCAFAAEQAEAVEVGLIAFSLDVYAVVGVVVFHITCQVALQAIAVHIASEAHVEHTAVDSYGIGF